MGTPDLPDLQPLTTLDDRLRQVATDETAVRSAIALARNALAEARLEADDAEIRRLLAYLGEAHRVLGELDIAGREIGEALARARESGDQRGVVANLIRLGEVRRCENRFADAETLLREALACIIEPEHEVYRDFALQHLGKTLLNAGRIVDARTILTEALAIRQRKGQASLIASTQEALAHLPTIPATHPMRRGGPPRNPPVIPSPRDERSVSSGVEGSLHQPER